MTRSRAFAGHRERGVLRAGGVVACFDHVIEAQILPREWGGDFLKEPWGTGAYVLDKYIVSEQASLKRRAVISHERR